jgi:uncharacterized protein YpmS
MSNSSSSEWKWKLIFLVATVVWGSLSGYQYHKSNKLEDATQQHQDKFREFNAKIAKLESDRDELNGKLSILSSNCDYQFLRMDIRFEALEGEQVVVTNFDANGTPSYQVYKRVQLLNRKFK